MASPQPEGFTGFPYGIGAPGLDMVAQTNPLTLPQTTTKTIFTIKGGPIRVRAMFGVVTTVVGAVANATKLQFLPTVPASTTLDLCATADINALAAGALYMLVTSFATAASISLTSGAGPVAASTLINNWIMTPGTVQINCAGSDGGTGLIQWYMVYAPLGVGIFNGGGVTVTMPLS